MGRTASKNACQRKRSGLLSSLFGVKSPILLQNLDEMSETQWPSLFKRAKVQSEGEAGSIERSWAEEREKANAPSSIAISITVIVYNYWFIYLPYLTWFYFDRLTPDKGGRRSSWVRSWTLWKYFKDYFPLRLVKTHNLDTSHNYIFGLHPHGILALGTSGNINLESMGFTRLFPGLTMYLHVTSCWFLFPLLREYMLSIGTVSVSKKSLSYILSKDGGGNVSAIIIGGAKEVLDCHPGKFVVLIRERKGFVKLALTHGAHLVPVFAFGENDLYKQVESPKGSWLRAVQERLQRMLTLPVPLFYGRGFFQHRFGLLPHRRPVHSVVGRPIPVQKTPNPTQEQVDALHQTYMDELTKLFDEHKGQYGVAEHETLILQ